MLLENLTILIISPDKWEYLSLSKHNYAIELSKKNKVYFLDPVSKKNNQVANDYGITVLNDYSSFRGLSKMPTFLSRFLMSFEVESILNKIEGNSVDLVWSFDTSRLFYLDLFKAKKSIAQIMDCSEDFNFKELVCSANICISMMDGILDRMREFNPNVHRVEHGYISNSLEVKDAVPNAKTVSGVYVGNLNMAFIDWESLLKIANAYPEIDLNFYGPLNDETKNANNFLKTIIDCPNVNFRGYLDPGILFQELISSTFCLVCYRHKDFGRQLDNSHKIMQYLGSGTPIFSSFTYEYRDLELLCMYDDAKNVLEKFAYFISKNNVFFTPEHSKKRIDFALENTYKKQVEKIAQLLQ